MYLYAISSLKTKYIYVGICSDFDQRFLRHNKGREKTTKHYKPFEVIFLLEAETRIHARLFEKYFKSGIGKEFLKSLRDAKVAELADA